MSRHCTGNFHCKKNENDEKGRAYTHSFYIVLVFSLYPISILDKKLSFPKFNIVKYQEDFSQKCHIRREMYKDKCQ